MILTDEQLDTLEGKFKRLAKEARIAPPSYEIFLLIAEVRRGRKIEAAVENYFNQMDWGDHDLLIAHSRLRAVLAEVAK